MMGPHGNAIVEFDANCLMRESEGEGFSSQNHLMAQQHHHMMLNAGQKHFPSQQQFGYGQR